MTDTEPDAPPDGWVVCEDYPKPGQTIMIWRQASSRFETSSWAPARVKDRRIRGLRSPQVHPALGYGRPFSVATRPVEHYATPGDPVTPTDTMTPVRPLPSNPTDPCVCGHTLRNHGKEDSRAVCFVCTHANGGCRGFTAGRAVPDSTAAERDAFTAGFNAGVVHGAEGANPHAATRDDTAERFYQQWVEGPGEDA